MSRGAVVKPVSRLILLSGACLVLAACQSTPQGNPPSASAGTSPTGEISIMQSAITVEPDVYSGRANPSWPLTADSAAEFLRKLRALPAAPPAEPSAPLGYRGFVARWTDGAQQDVVTVQTGRVKWATGNRARYLADPRRDLERWLLETGRSRLDAETVSIVESALPH